MKRIGILSDTHGAIPGSFSDFFKDVDEIWHAGDIGSIEALSQIGTYKPLRAVFGNIDGLEIRQYLTEDLVFECDGVKVLMTHIGGYPGKYNSRARALIVSEKPGLFVCGHSHILKVMFDQKYQLLYINPGAAGNSGLHKHITMIRCILESGRIRDLEIFEKQRK